MGRLVARITQEVRTASDAWHAFWFTPRDPTMLCLMRVLVGGMVAYTIFVWGIEFDAFFGKDGWNGAELLATVQGGGVAPSFWWYVPEGWAWTVHCCCIAIAVLFMAGLCTRVTSVLTMIILISYSYRAHLANYGLDQINAILTFYLCLAPCGARFSIDSYLRSRKGRGATATPTMSTNLATRLIQVHFCVIYSFAGIAKLQGEGWWNGEAVWMAFANTEYQTIDMTWIAWYPWISDVMTHGTMIFELTFWFLIWTRLRPIVLAVAASLHLGIGAIMGMWTFGWIMIFGHLAFWSPALIRSLTDQWFGEDSAREPEKVPHSRSSPRAMAARARAQEFAEAATTPIRIVCIDENAKSRMRCVNYFTQKGVDCFPIDTLSSGLTLARESGCAFILIPGQQFDLSELAEFWHDATDAIHSREVVVLMSPALMDQLEDETSERIHVLPNTTSFGDIHRLILQRSRCRVAQPVAVAANHQSSPNEEHGECDTHHPGKPR